MQSLPAELLSIKKRRFNEVAAHIKTVRRVRSGLQYRIRIPARSQKKNAPVHFLDTPGHFRAGFRR